MVYFFSELARTLTLLTLGHLASCMPASPLGWQETLSDGTVSPTLYVRGDESFNFIIDEKGYTVVDGINGEKYYAEKDELTGNVKASRLKVGKADPRKNGLAPAALPDRTVINGMKRKFLNVKGRSDCVQGDCTRRLVEEQSNRKLTTSGTLQTLLVMMRFKDHKNRSLPSSDDYDKLLNGGDVTIAPTGSVRDVYLESSYGKLLINATAYGWVDLPETEAYYADGDYGLTSVFFEAVDFALGIINNDETFHFRDFDRNNDGLIDSIIFTHSGYGAEWGGPGA